MEPTVVLPPELLSKYTMKLTRLCVPEDPSWFDQTLVMPALEELILHQVPVVRDAYPNLKFVAWDNKFIASYDYRLPPQNWVTYCQRRRVKLINMNGVSEEDRDSPMTVPYFHG